jgi:hypothetical protein
MTADKLPLLTRGYPSHSRHGLPDPAEAGDDHPAMISGAVPAHGHKGVFSAAVMVHRPAGAAQGIWSGPGWT